MAVSAPIHAGVARAERSQRPPWPGLPDPKLKRIAVPPPHTDRRGECAEGCTGPQEGEASLLGVALLGAWCSASEWKG
jgi:hypothetical protein